MMRLRRHFLLFVHLCGGGNFVPTTGWLRIHQYSLHAGPSVSTARSNAPPRPTLFFVPSQCRHPRRWNTMAILYSSSTTNTNTYYPRIDTTENAIRDTDALQSWATLVCGIQQLDGLTFYSSSSSNDDANNDINDDGDIAMATMVDITAGTCILYVPSMAVISATSVHREFGRDLFEKPENLLSNLLTTSGSSSSSSSSSDQYTLFYLFFKLLIEYERGTGSDWYTYLNSLPRLYNTGASLTPSCYDCLPPLAAKLCMEQRVRCINMRQALKTIPTDTLHEYVSVETLANDELLKFIYNVIETRSVMVNDGKERILAPMVDMFNHASNGHEVELTYDVTSGDCFVHTITNVPSGTVLHTSYGEYYHTNPSATFAKYGFIDTSCISSYCKMMNIIPSTELRNIGLSYSRMLFYSDTGDVSEEVYDVILYQILSETSNWQGQREFYTACITNDTELKSEYHAMYIGQTMMKLKNHVDTFLKDLDDLYDKARAKDVMKHPRLPLILSHNNYIQSTFMTVKDKIDPIIAQMMM